MRSCLWEFGILQQGYIYGGVAYCSKGTIMRLYLWGHGLLQQRINHDVIFMEVSVIASKGH